jgi:acyl-CoA synthetase (AMP-forming)/AMP-acid ligase II
MPIDRFGSFAQFRARRERFRSTLGDHQIQNVAEGAETLSFHTLLDRSNRYARWARANGVKKGDAVCLLMPNRPEYMAIWAGIGAPAALWRCSTLISWALLWAAAFCFPYARRAL